MSKRCNQKQIWADGEFVDRLEELRAKALLNHRIYGSISDLTKELVKSPAFIEVEKELIENVKKLKGVRFDRRWF